MSDEAHWQYEVDSVQRGGVTAKVKARRHGEVSRPDATDGRKPHNQHSEEGKAFDASGIPTGI